MNLLQQSAQAWKEITEYRYLFTYGYKKQLYPINLSVKQDKAGSIDLLSLLNSFSHHNKSSVFCMVRTAGQYQL